MCCTECRRLAKAYRRVLKERARINDRMIQAANESDLGRFQCLSRAMDSMHAYRVGVQVAMESHNAVHAYRPSRR